MQEEQLCIHCVNEAIQRDARPGAISNGRGVPKCVCVCVCVFFLIH